ncbi:MAG: hypothetical protein NT155_01050 [Candidatus Staskawiczbacteria bacterium]|nr:hypothetical protein [Candidatus Staskawiczbacteria bacterium]
MKKIKLLTCVGLVCFSVLLVLSFLSDTDIVHVVKYIMGGTTVICLGVADFLVTRQKCRDINNSRLYKP